MKSIKNVLLALLVALAPATTSLVAYAEGDLPKVSGEVRKVKPDSGKITIKHEPIPNLDMPGMSMVFRTEEGLDISQFKKGDVVEFTVVEKDGKMVIMSIDKSE